VHKELLAKAEENKKESKKPAKITVNKDSDSDESSDSEVCINYYFLLIMLVIG
jgi:hypothetical protein